MKFLSTPKANMFRLDEEGVGKYRDSINEGFRLEHPLVTSRYICPFVASPTAGLEIARDFVLFGHQLVAQNYEV